MPAIKNKTKLCETKLSDFSIEQIHGIPFYSRYQEIANLFKKRIPSVDFQRCFAQPYENKAKRVIEWYYIPTDSQPSRLSDMSDSTPLAEKRNAIISAVQTALKDAGENERPFLNAVLVGIGEGAESSIYEQDGDILFGIWGMKAKAGRKVEDVIREDVQDHRVFSVKYKIKGEGRLSSSSVSRKYGYRLTSADVPEVFPEERWTFVRWEPDMPQGWTVKDNVTFTAICEKKESHVEEGDSHGGMGITDTESDDRNPPEPPKSQFHVHFGHENGGRLYGETHYWKSEGERIYSSEIPTAVPDEGYEFVGWDRHPEGHEVYGDTTFIARFREKEGLVGITDSDPKKTGWWASWWGRGGCLTALLNWLLLILGLLLIFLLLWCFIFGNCRLGYCVDNDCGCDDVPPTEIVNDNPPPPVQKPCNTQQASGGYEKYMGYFDMGQPNGKFVFEYNTLTQPDRITIYDGKGTDGRIIYTYEGGTEDWTGGVVEFHQQIVTVTVEGLGPGTVWHFRANCPND